MVTNLVQALKQKDDTHDLRNIHLPLFKSKEQLYGESAAYSYYLARIYDQLGANVDAESYFSKALEIDSNISVYRLRLGESQLKPNPENSFNTVKPLIQAEYDNPSKSSFAFAERVCRVYCRVLIYLERYDDVLQFTSSWESNESLSRVLGISRSICLRRQHESYVRKLSNLDQVLNSIEQQQIILNTLLTRLRDGEEYVDLLNEAEKFISFCTSIIANPRIGTNELQLILKNFLLKHSEKVQIPERSREVINRVFSDLTNTLNIDNFKSPSKLIEEGYILVFLPKFVPGEFTFGSDKLGNSYYIPKGSYSINNKITWESLTRKHELYVKAIPNSYGTANFKAIEAWSTDPLI